MTTGCGRFRLEPHGTTRFEGAQTRPVPAEAWEYWPSRIWVGVSHRHLELGRGLRLVWRSSGHYPRKHVDVENVVLGRHSLAFSYYGRRQMRLYIAPAFGRERAVSHDETPLAYTRSGDLVTWSVQSRALLLRSGSGRLERRIANRATDLQAARGGTTVIFGRHGRLFAFDGARVRELASLVGLQLGRDRRVEPLKRLLAVHGERRLVLLDYAGHRRASTLLPKSPKRPAGAWSDIVANAAGTAVAFAAPAGGREAVFVLRVGARRASAVLRVRADLPACGRWAGVAWHGRWVLYSDTGQNAVVVDGKGEQAPVPLGRAIARLPGLRPDGNGPFDVNWG